MLVVALIDSIDLLQRFDVSTFDNFVELRSNKVQIVREIIENSEFATEEVAKFHHCRMVAIKLL